MAKAKDSKQLSRMELLFVAVYQGNQVEAAKLAGFKHPKKMGSVIYNRPRVKAACEKKMEAAIQASGKEFGKAITISRNDIVNRLDDLSQNADSDSAKVAALRALTDIFGMKASDAKGDPFAGWTDEELEHYRKTQEFPAWLIPRTKSS